MIRADTKILLVEDNDLDVIMIQRLMKKLLLDFPIIRARNGEEALALLRPDGAKSELAPPFVMLIDINMPRMGGFELLDQLADDPVLATIPTFIVSTSDSPTDRQTARQYRIRGYVVKPVTDKVLLDMLDSEDGSTDE